MEWTKIKPQHFLYTDYTLANIGCLTVLICLTAQLERMPTELEMVQHTHKKSLCSLNSALKQRGYCINNLLSKVLEDCDGVKHKRDLSCLSSDRYRKKQREVKVVGDTSLSSPEKRREENTICIVDKSTPNTRNKFIKPSLTDVKNYIEEGGYAVNYKAFYDWYEGNGWKVGKNQMKDWKACVRTWHHKDNTKGGGKYAQIG